MGIRITPCNYPNWIIQYILLHEFFPPIMEPTYTNVAILIGVFIFGYLFNDIVAHLWDTKSMNKEEYDKERKRREEASLAYVPEVKQKVPEDE